LISLLGAAIGFWLLPRVGLEEPAVEVEIVLVVELVLVVLEQLCLFFEPEFVVVVSGVETNFFTTQIKQLQLVLSECTP